MSTEKTISMIGTSREHFQKAYSVPSGGWYYERDPKNPDQYKDEGVQACWEEWQRLEQCDLDLYAIAWYVQQFRTNWRAILKQREFPWSLEC